MKLLVIGGRGATGKQVVELARQAGHEVVAPGHAECDVTKAADLERAAAGCDAAVVLLSPKKKDDPVRSQAAAAFAKVKAPRRLIWVSSCGAGDSVVSATKTSWVFGKVIIPLVLKQQFADAAVAEETLRGSGLELTVLRPMELVDQERPGEATAIAPDAKSPSAKISRAQLARFIVKELAERAHTGKMPVLYG